MKKEELGTLYIMSYEAEHEGRVDLREYIRMIGYGRAYELWKLSGKYEKERDFLEKMRKKYYE